MTDLDPDVVWREVEFAKLVLADSELTSLTASGKRRLARAVLLLAVATAPAVCECDYVPLSPPEIDRCLDCGLLRIPKEDS